MTKSYPIQGAQEVAEWAQRAHLETQPGDWRGLLKVGQEGWSQENHWRQEGCPRCTPTGQQRENWSQEQKQKRKQEERA